MISLHALLVETFTMPVWVVSVGVVVFLAFIGYVLNIVSSNSTLKEAVRHNVESVKNNGKLIDKLFDTKVDKDTLIQVNERLGNIETDIKKLISKS